MSGTGHECAARVLSANQPVDARRNQDGSGNQILTHFFFNCLGVSLEPLRHPVRPIAHRDVADQTDHTSALEWLERIVRFPARRAFARSPINVTGRERLRVRVLDLEVFTYSVALPDLVAERHWRTESAKDYDRAGLLIGRAVNRVEVVEEFVNVTQHIAIGDFTSVEDNAILG